MVVFEITATLFEKQEYSFLVYYNLKQVEIDLHVTGQPKTDASH